MIHKRLPWRIPRLLADHFLSLKSESEKKIKGRAGTHVEQYMTRNNGD